jgi:hypothetical protein
MWKELGLVLTVTLVGLGSDRAEARFGKRSQPSSPPSTSNPRPHPSTGVGTPRPNPYYGRGYGYGYYGFYDPWDPWARYYYNPAWAWPFMGPGAYRPFGRHYDLMWGRRMPPPSVEVDEKAGSIPKAVFSADAGLVAQGRALGFALQADGERFGLSARLHMLDLETDDGSPGRDNISLLSLKPSALLVSTESLRVRVSGGLDVAFAPDVIMVGPGVGSSAQVRLLGPLKAEASVNWTLLPFTQLTGDAGLAADWGPMGVRGGYRAIYLNDQGRVDGYVNRELFTGPYVGLGLHL